MMTPISCLITPKPGTLQTQNEGEGSAADGTVYLAQWFKAQVLEVSCLEGSVSAASSWQSDGEIIIGPFSSFLICKRKTVCCVG